MLSCATAIGDKKFARQVLGWGLQISSTCESGASDKMHGVQVGQEEPALNQTNGQVSSQPFLMLQQP